jgi:hypothetical protein
VSQIDDNKRSKVPPGKARLQLGFAASIRGSSFGFRDGYPRLFRTQERRAFSPVFQLGRARVTGGKFPYILIHQLEGNLIAPLIQRQLIFIPPAVMLLAIVTVLFVFGGFVVIFAGPIAVIIFVAVNKPQ